MAKQQQGHIGLYILSLTAMLLGVACIAIVLYILPWIIFHLQYDVPYYVYYIHVWYETQEGITGNLGLILLILPFLLAAGALFLIAAVVDRYLETHHEPGLPDLTEDELHAHDSYTRYSSLRVVASATGFHPWWLVIGLILIVAILLIAGEYLVSINLF